MKKYTRAEVTPDFMNAVIEIAKARIAAFAQEIKYASSHNQAMIRSAKAPVVAKLMKLRTQEGRDFEITRFRGLDYIKFDVVEFRSVLYVTARTSDIVMALWAGHKPPTPITPRWNMGPYIIYVKLDDLKNGRTGDIHFVPEREPLTRYRHPHHKGYWHTTNEANGSSPLQMSPSTCWGSFGQIVSDCIKNGDVVEMFRAFHSYLGRFNSGSPLAGGVEYCPFAQGDKYASSYSR